MQRIARNYEKKNNTWNIRRLGDELFVPATQRIILKIVGFLETRADINSLAFWSMGSYEKLLLSVADL